MDGMVRLKMKDVNKVISWYDFVLNTGSPHYVKIVNDGMNMDVLRQGKEIRYNEEF